MSCGKCSSPEYIKPSGRRTHLCRFHYNEVTRKYHARWKANKQAGLNGTYERQRLIANDEWYEPNVRLILPENHEAFYLV